MCLSRVRMKRTTVTIAFIHSHCPQAPVSLKAGGRRWAGGDVVVKARCVSENCEKSAQQSRSKTPLD